MITKETRLRVNTILDLELPKVREIRAMDLSEIEREALREIGWIEPLSSRIGRGEMFVLETS